MRINLETIMDDLWRESRCDFETFKKSTVELIGNFIFSEVREIRAPEDLLRFVARHYKVTLTQLRSGDCTRRTVKARHTYYYLAHCLLKKYMSLREIAMPVNQVYSNVLKGVRVVRNEMQIYPDFNHEVLQLLNKAKVLIQPVDEDFT